MSKITRRTTATAGAVLARAGAALVVGSLTIAGSITGSIGVAAAAPITDSDPGASTIAVERLTQVDGLLRLSDALLPDAVAAADHAAARVGAARVGEARALSARPASAPSPGDAALDPAAGTDVADVAADAILDDLEPERATAEREAAELAAADATARRDALFGSIVAAGAERAQLLAMLETTGQARTRWSVALLDALDAPVTQDNLRGLSAWIGAEGNTVRANNPLATTMGAQGAVDLNDHGVKGYPNDVVGIDATVRTLRNGSYDGILAALAAGDSAGRVVHAVAASPWGTGENAVRRLALDS